MLMRTKVVLIHLLLSMALLTSCSDEQQLVIVTVDGLTQEVTELAVTLQLDNHPAKENDLSVKMNLKEFVIRIPKASSDRSLFVSVTGMDSKGVGFSGGTNTVTVMAGTVPTRVPIQLSKHYECSVDHWCKYNPLPQTNNLNGIWGSDAKNVWAVGDGGTTLKWDGTAWVDPQINGPTNILQAVGGLDANNLWAVGWPKADGTSGIFKWDGTKWTPIASPPLKDISGLPRSNYRAVQWLGPDNIWATADYCQIRQLRGGTWNNNDPSMTNCSPPPTNAAWLYGVWGPDATSIWVVGQGGTILKWAGGVWTTEANPDSAGPPKNFLTAIWGLSATNIWAVGRNGTSLHRDATTWSLQPSGTPNDLLAIGGYDSQNVWTVGTGGTIRKWDGLKWNRQESDTSLNLNAIWALDANNVWAVGQNGIILRYLP